MNTSFRNSNIGFILYALIIIIIAGVFLITVWYMLFGYRLGTYSENTVIGSVYLGGLQETELERKVNQKIDIWLDDPTIVFELTYQGYSYEFDRNLIFFDLDESKSNLVQGQSNELVAEYQILGDRDDFQLVVEEIRELPFLDDIIDNVDVEKIVNDILDDAGLMKTYSSKEVENYLIVPEDSYMTLNTVSITVPEGFVIDELVNGISSLFGANEIPLESQVLFDVLAEMHEKLSDIELTLLAEAMLQLSHETNFTVHEVHYVPRYNTNNYTFETFHFGSNAHVNRDINYSFSLYNPNDSTYRFVVEADTENEGVLLVSLYGLEFVDDIDVTINIQEIPFITQFSQNPLHEQSGEVGAVVTVRRVITNLDEEVIFDQDIIFEYYQPKSEIILEE